MLKSVLTPFFDFAKVWRSSPIRLLSSHVSFCQPIRLLALHRIALVLNRSEDTPGTGIGCIEALVTAFALSALYRDAGTELCGSRCWRGRPEDKALYRYSCVSLRLPATLFRQLRTSIASIDICRYRVIIYCLVMIPFDLGYVHSDGFEGESIRGEGEASMEEAILKPHEEEADKDARHGIKRKLSPSPALEDCNLGMAEFADPDTCSTGDEDETRADFARYVAEIWLSAHTFNSCCLAPSEALDKENY